MRNEFGAGQRPGKPSAPSFVRMGARPATSGAKSSPRLAPSRVGPLGCGAAEICSPAMSFATKAPLCGQTVAPLTAPPATPTQSRPLTPALAWRAFFQRPLSSPPSPLKVGALGRGKAGDGGPNVPKSSHCGARNWSNRNSTAAAKRFIGWSVCLSQSGAAPTLEHRPLGRVKWPLLRMGLIKANCASSPFVGGLKNGKWPAN